MRRGLVHLSALALCLLTYVSAEASEERLDDMFERVMPIRTHSLQAPYVDSDLQNRWWDFGNDAIINTNKHVRLTQDRPSQSGWLWSRMPLTMASWRVEVEFKVDGKGNSLYGDGFAIWVSKDRATVGPVFGSVDYFNGLGIFFDTYANSRSSHHQWPVVTAMMGDGKTEYDHNNDNKAHEIAYCSENFRRRDIPTKARLTYIKGKTLQLDLQLAKSDEWTKCFAIDQTLPDSPYIGFSAATGDVSDSHDIVSVSAYNLILKPEYREEQRVMHGGSPQATGQSKGSRKSAKKSGGGSAAGWFMFILKVIGVGAFIAFAVAAVRTYNAQKKSKRAW